MRNGNKRIAAIIDYGMGNLFSVARACEIVGITPDVTNDRKEIQKSDLVILPGVGAYAGAMARLRSLGLIDTLKGLATDGKPFIGICLGMQLMMRESEEFGIHEGLGLFPGKVVRLAGTENGKPLKVPTVGWNRVLRASEWNGTLLSDTKETDYLYFVHSNHVQLDNPTDALAVTPFGDMKYCSAISRDNLFACQFHPERSREAGLRIYQLLAKRLFEKETEHSLVKV